MRGSLAVDPFYFGEARPERQDYLFALLLATVGDRPLGIQASQLAAVARWSAAEMGKPIKVVAVGPRLSTVALVAAGLEDRAIGEVELHGALGSLKEVIEQNRSLEQMPELFSFGLPEAFHIKQLAALTAPRPLAFIGASPRVRTELAGLRGWYKALGVEREPLR